MNVPDAQLSHVGIYVSDLDRAQAFYCRLLGLVVTDAGDSAGRRLAFLSRSVKEHHQLVLVWDPSRHHADTTVNQLAFQLKSLEDLQRYHALLSAENTPDLVCRDHGNAWSVYFFDPDGNKIELYVPTPWHAAQPGSAPLDLQQPAAAIRAHTEQRLKSDPTSRPIADWQADMGRWLEV